MSIPENRRVAIEEGVVFGQGGGRDLKCNIYRPPEGTANGTALVLVHGGGWREGDPTQLHGYGVLLGREGYTCIAPEYRLTPEAKWPAQIEDVKAAIRWVRANAADLGIDPERICIEGNSAGAHLALVAAGAPDDDRLEGSGGNPGVSSAVAACVAIYPPADLRRNSPLGGVIRELFEADAGDDTIELASPITMSRPDFPPTQLIHGTRDELVPVEESLAMFRALEGEGVAVEIHLYADQPHAFDAAPAYGRQCAELMRLFFDRYVTRPEAFRPEQHSTTEAVAQAT
jgi:acetyl esterase/lipase